MYRPLPAMKTTAGGEEVEIKAGSSRSLLESFSELQTQKKATRTGFTGRKAELVASGAP